MTEYTVAWQRACESELAELWLTFPDPEQITDAANELDKLLRGDPLNSGVPLHEGLRVITVPPIRAIYSVSEADKLVEVWRIKLFP